MILVDSNSILFRYIFSLPERMNSDGVIVNGLYGYCRFLCQFFDKKYKIIACFDKCTNNFRKKINSKYKDNRPTFPPSIYKQIDLAIEFCQNTGIQVSFHDTYEADDIIASYANKYSGKKIIFSSDKDLIALINDEVQLYNPFLRKYIDEIYTLSKFDVVPEPFSFFLALCGDSSDNIAGIKGIGPKTAAKIIKETQNIEEMKLKYKKYNFDNLEHMLSLTNLYMQVPTNIEKTALNIDKMKDLYLYFGFYELLNDKIKIF